MDPRKTYSLALLIQYLVGTIMHGRPVARSENPGGGLVVMGGDNVPTLVEIG